MQEFTQNAGVDSRWQQDSSWQAGTEALDAMWRRIGEFEGDVKRLVTSDLDNPVGIFYSVSTAICFHPEELEDFRG